MKILVLLQHYHTPDCPTAARPWSLVRALAQRHEVTVLATDVWRARRLTEDFDWMPADVGAEIVSVSYANEMAIGRRLRSYLSYAGQALWAGLQLPRPDLVYASSTPLTVGAVGAGLAAWWGCPWVFEVRDLWPDFPIQMGALDFAGPVRPVLARALRSLEQALYRDAGRVIAASPDMVAHVRRFTDPARVSSVPYGTALDILEQVSEKDEDAVREKLMASGVPDGHPIVSYAGSFGRANAVPTLVDAARHLKPGEAHFVFAGPRQGFHRSLLEEAERRLTHVHLLEPQPYRRTLALFQRADVSLVSFIDRPVLQTNAPSKFFDSLSAGTPVVVTNPGWTKAFVEQHECGWYVPPEQPQALACALREVLHHEPMRRAAGQRGARAARAHFDRRVHMRRLLDIIDEVVA